MLIQHDNYSIMTQNISTLKAKLNFRHNPYNFKKIISMLFFSKI